MVKLRTSIHLALVLILLLSLTIIAPAQIMANQDENGSFDILMLANGDWQLQGEISFSDYETLPLPLGNEAGQVTLRLVQQGHDAAFVDYVALQKSDISYSPISAINLDSGSDVLSKVLSPEYDVCDAWDSTTEIVWDNVPGNSMLVMRAMEEDLGEGHGTPLFYPAIFIGQTLSHTLVNDGGITVDGVMEETRGPDFSVFWEPDSPHPDGYTYGWLHSDDDYLYATIEVTADNTSDEEDWGALYVMVNGEPEEFRITGSDLIWGFRGFQYTSLVPYQHRVYEFAIPLSKIDARIGDEIHYAFGCYGTVIVIGEAYVDDDCDGVIHNGTPEYPFCTIQAGVDAVFPGGTVYVAAGDYNEHVLIDKPLTILGAGCGESEVHDFWIDDTNNVTINGFSIHGADSNGVLIELSQDCSILHNCIYDNDCGIYLNDSSGNEIYCNDIYNNNPENASGIHLVGDSANNRINYNNFYDNDYGVFNETSNQVDAENNWWGCADGPGGGGCDVVYGDVDYTPFLSAECEVCPFDAETTPVVGGIVYPVDKLTILLPWILGCTGLGVLLALLWSRYHSRPASGGHP